LEVAVVLERVFRGGCHGTGHGHEARTHTDDGDRAILKAPGPGRLDGAPVGLSDLVRGSLVDLDGSEPTSLTDRLDTDYLRGFLRSTANTRRSTTASGSYRLDARSAQLPQMELQRQQEYGAAFRHLAAFEDRLRQVTALGGRASALAHDGLTNDALLPPVDPKSRKARQR
jgi:hypothetical protein